MAACFSATSWASWVITCSSLVPTASKSWKKCKPELWNYEGEIQYGDNKKNKDFPKVESLLYVNLHEQTDMHASANGFNKKAPVESKTLAQMRLSYNQQK